MNLPPYTIFPTVIGNSITLRQIEPADMNDIIEISYYNAIQATSAQQAAAMQAKINNDYISGNSIHWGIANNANNKLVGTCGYYRGFTNKAGELGCVLLAQHQGKGFMTLAMQLAINFGFTTMNLKHIWAETTKDNKNALNLFERLNFFVIDDVDENSIKLGISKID